MKYYVIDYFTKCKADRLECFKFVNSIENGIKFYEYTKLDDKLIPIHDNSGVNTFYNKEVFGNRIVFNKQKGSYVILDTLTNITDLVCSQYEFNTFYNYTFPKHYEARESFLIFDNKQSLIDKEQDFKLSNYLKYTFGLEFETAIGTIPEDICFRDGLIPLRDGSITGNEYSTVVLNGNFGLNLLKQQLNTLSEYTHFDKNCSLHIHLGNFELVPDVIWHIYKNCLYLQNELINTLPKYTFKSSAYKDTGKDYCKLLPSYDSFERLYEKVTGFPYFGSLYEPHPRDLEHERKWNISQRYFWINFVNALCYSENKTIEFRFLRPTYNFNKIIFWLFIFNAILVVSENKCVITSLDELVHTVYPKDIADELIKNIVKTQICTRLQTKLNDFIGERVDIENRIFNTNELL